VALRKSLRTLFTSSQLPSLVFDARYLTRLQNVDENIFQGDIPVAKEWNASKPETGQHVRFGEEVRALLRRHFKLEGKIPAILHRLSSRTSFVSSKPMPVALLLRQKY
jgi:hypothetical protein